MKTRMISPAEMEARISRFDGLRSLPAQREVQLPKLATDLIWGRTVLPAIGMEGDREAIANSTTAIAHAGEMRLGFVICPAGAGPSLHAHFHTYETFTVMEGRLEVRWNDHGEDRVVLERFDTISVPPGVCRSFRNIGAEDAIIQVLITGDLATPDYVEYTPETKGLIEEIEPAAVEAFERLGLTFTAGQD